VSSYTFDIVSISVILLLLFLNYQKTCRGAFFLNEPGYKQNLKERIIVIIESLTRVKSLTMNFCCYRVLLRLIDEVKNLLYLFLKNFIISIYYIYYVVMNFMKYKTRISNKKGYSVLMLIQIWLNSFHSKGCL